MYMIKKKKNNNNSKLTVYVNVFNKEKKRWKFAKKKLHLSKKWEKIKNNKFSE